MSWIKNIKRIWSEFHLCSYVELSYEYRRGWGTRVYTVEKYKCIKCGRIITVYN